MSDSNYCKDCHSYDCKCFPDYESPADELDRLRKENLQMRNEIDILMAGRRSTPPLEQKTTVVNVKLAPYDVYIGRANRSYGLAASPFGNPFIPGRDGTPQECLALYREHVTSTPALMRLLPSLKGKRHGDVLVELIEEKPNDI